MDHTVAFMGAGGQYRGRSGTCPGIVSRSGALTARPDQCTAISEVADMVAPRHAVVELEGVIIHEDGDFRRRRGCFNPRY